MTTREHTGALTVTRQDARYADLVSGLNQRYQGTPEAVRIPRSTAEVIAVVQDAADRGKRVSVRSSGHCYEDFVFHPDVEVVIDMSGMSDVYFDPHRRAIAVESGATNLRTYQATYPRWGVVVPAGFCYSVAMGGHVCGGAWGPLARQHGLVVDHLEAVEVVVVDSEGRARAVVASRSPHDPNHDLWWAHTGAGGGSFGVVTRYWFRTPGAAGHDPASLLPRPPASLLVSAVSWPWEEISAEEFGRIAQNYAAWHVENLTTNTELMSQLVLTHRSAGQIGLLALVDATAPNAHALLTSYLSRINAGVSVTPGALTTPMAELPAMPQFVNTRTLPWMQAIRLLGTTNATLNDPTLRAEYKSAFMRAQFPARHLTALHEHLTRTDIANPTAAVQLTSYGGRIAAVAPEVTASAHRDAAFKLQWQVFWNNPAEDDLHVRWARESYAAVYAETGGVPVPDDVTDGCYVNYPDADLGDPEFNKSSVDWHDLYHKQNYPRLQRVKARWDPRDFFRHAQSIRLP